MVGIASIGEMSDSTKQINGNMEDDVILASNIDSLVSMFTHLNLQTPSSRQPQLAENLLELHNTELAAAANLVEQQHNMSEHSFIGLIAHTSWRHVDDLISIKISEMQCPQIHYGRYLYCRTISRPLNGNPIKTIIQDSDGEVEMLYVCDVYEGTPDTWIPEGTALMIKEPNMTVSMSGVNALHVSSPTDLVLCLERIDKIKQFDLLKCSNNSVKDNRREGCSSFTAGKYLEAIRQFNLSICVQDGPEALLYKAHACLRIKRYYEAYHSANAARALDAENMESYILQAKAAYGMRNWKESFKLVTAASIIGMKSKDMQPWLLKIQHRVQESRMGKYDFRDIYNRHARGEMEFDVADYIGPVEMINTNGRGLRVTKDVKTGELLMSSKAVAYTPAPMATVTWYNVITRRLVQAEEGENMKKVIIRLFNNPDIRNDIYSLYAGPNIQFSKDVPFDVIDTYLIQSICTYSCFRFYEPGGVSSSVGLWIMPSRINHSCIPNVMQRSTGDLMCVNALCDLKKGDEILMSYCPQSVSYSERSQQISLYGFVCNCLKCKSYVASQGNDKHRKRRYVANRIRLPKPKFIQLAGQLEIQIIH